MGLVEQLNIGVGRAEDREAGGGGGGREHTDASRACRRSQGAQQATAAPFGSLGEKARQRPKGCQQPGKEVRRLRLSKRHLTIQSLMARACVVLIGSSWGTCKRGLPLWDGAQGRLHGAGFSSAKSLK